MPDSDERGSAWRVSPSQYLQTRAPTYAVPAAPRSLYLTMRDGCRLAADIWLPQPAAQTAPARLPTILILTPYYRRFRVKPGAHIDACPNTSKYRDFFVPRGYAVVVVDVRGTGASFGTRDSFRSPREREDSRDIADWIVAQPWSDGGIGATGISYLGAASDFLASTGHPAVKAVAPLFAVWDTYSDHYYPGGVLLNQLAKTYDELMVGLDHDRRDVLRQFSYYADPNLDGPHPVDEDVDGSLCKAAVAEHLGNFHMPDFITEFRFKEEPLPYDPDFSSASFSPYHYAKGIPPDIAIYSVSGWMDGAGYANGSIARYLTLPNKHQHLLLGPWDHGARINVSPWRQGEEPQFILLADILRFFDEYLMGLSTGLREEAPIHYFTMRDEVWRAAHAWPPLAEKATRLLLADGQTLDAAAGAAGTDIHKVDFSFGTGGQTRYERIAAIDSRNYYSDWQGRDAALLNYTSAPLERAAEFTGHAVAELWLAASEAARTRPCISTSRRSRPTAPCATSPRACCGRCTARTRRRRRSIAPPGRRTAIPAPTLRR